MRIKEARAGALTGSGPFMGYRTAVELITFFLVALVLVVALNLLLLWFFFLRR